MNWLILFVGLALATLAGLLPAGAATVCRVIAVVAFALGAALILAGMAG
jgi:hypothetical protein